MSDDIIVYPHRSGNLGDFIFTTALFREKRGILQIGRSDGSTALAPAVESVCDFQLMEEGTVKSDLNMSLDRETHHAVQILNYCGLKGANPIPRIFPRQLQLERMRWKLAGIKNPIVFHPLTINVIPTCSTTGYRDIPLTWIEPIIKALHGYGFTPITFVSIAREQYPQFPGVGYFKTTLDEFLAGCALVGRYIGIDCGVLHTMIAVGGKVLGLVPPHDYLYFPHGNYLWTENLWTHEPVRAKYLEFKDASANFISGLDFLVKN